MLHSRHIRLSPHYEHLCQLCSLFGVHKGIQSNLLAGQLVGRTLVYSRFNFTAEETGSERQTNVP